MDPATGKIYNLKTVPPPQAVTGRLTIRSNDQSEQIVRGRIRKYNMELAPIVDQVNAQAPGKLCRISSMQTIEQVHTQLCQELGLGEPIVPGAVAEAADDGWGAADDDGWGAAPEAAAEMQIDLRVGPSQYSGGPTNVAVSARALLAAPVTALLLLLWLLHRLPLLLLWLLGNANRLFRILYL